MNTIMLDYINETPQRMVDLINYLSKENKAIDLNVEHVVFVGSGSSLNISKIASVFYEESLGILCSYYLPEEFSQKERLGYKIENTVVIGISQTGTSSGTVHAIMKAKSLGYKTITLTEKKETPLQEAGDYYFNFMSGEENVNAKTKGYTNSLLLLYCLGLMISKKDRVLKQEVFSEIEKTISDIKLIIANFENWMSINKEWIRMNNFLVVSVPEYRGSSDEAALKVLETLGVPGISTTIEEFSHGLHRTIDHNSTIFLINSKKQDLKRTYNYFEPICARIVMVNSSDTTFNNEIKVNHRLYNLSSISIGVIFQLIAYFFPQHLGLDPNRKLNQDYERIVQNRLI